MTNAKQPDPLPVVATWLKNQPAVTAVIAKRVAPYLTGAYPAVRLADVGPRDRGPEEALNRVQIECWADDYDSASDLARVIERHVPELRGAYAGAWCAGGAVALGPFASPDTSSNRYRHILDVELWLYPAPVPV